MFFTIEQLSEFIHSITFDKDIPLFNSTNNYLISQVDFPNFFHIVCKRIEINNKERMRKAISYGEILLNQYDTHLKDASIHLKNNFYMKIDRFDFFIAHILYPLLMILKERKDYYWQSLPNKWGLWRELGKNEKMPIGGEVSMNFNTGKNWLKMQ